MTEPLLLYNPQGGTKLEPSQLSRFECLLKTVNGTLLTTGSARQARRMLKRMNGDCDTVIVAGGDDTIRGVLPAILNKGLKLGIVPTGTCNNLAHSLGLSSDPVRALFDILHGETRYLDLGELNGHLFTESAGVGFVAHAWSKAPAEESFSGFGRWLMGLKATLEAAIDFEPPRLRVSLDDELFQGEVWNVTVANAPLFCGRMPIAPLARLDDGLLDVCLMPFGSKDEIFTLVSSLLDGSHLGALEQLIYRQARSLRITLDTPGVVRIDNSLHRLSRLEARVVPQRLRLLAPRPASALAADR